jgi:hypothetical protein
MFLAFLKARIRRHAKHIFAELLGDDYDGEVFLCGGAFKPLLKRKLPINDYDLWVRDNTQRGKLIHFLLERGATIARDYAPYCLKLRLDGRIIEITYHNVGDGRLEDVINTFDLAVCGMGARYAGHRVEEVFVGSGCWEAIRQRSVRTVPGYMCFLSIQHAASLVRTLHRMGQQAAELGYEVDTAHEHALWEIFWRDFSESERREAVDLYFETMVTHSGRCDERLMRRAMVGFTPPMPKAKEQSPIPHLFPQPA